MNDISQHKEAFCNYIRKGTEDDLAFLEKKVFNHCIDADGGFLLPPCLMDRINKTIFQNSPMRQLASVTTVSSDSLEILEGDGCSGWSKAERDYDESSHIGKKTIAPHELFAQPRATQKLIDDSSVDIGEWLVENLVDVFSRTENTAFISGTGTGQPKGILDYAAGTAWGQIERISANKTIQSDSVAELYYSLKEEYATHATLLMNRATAQQVRLLKESTTNKYLWQPGLAAGAPDTLLGLPVMQAADMPDNTIAVADFKRAYQIVDRAGVRVLRDPYTDKPFVKFYSTKRVGGDVTNFEAIKILEVK